MEEIKAGEFVRLKDGKILKFNKFGTLRVGCSNPKYFKTIISNRRHYKYDNIVKHSFNIIDLIGEDDYVNGYLIDENMGKYLKTLDIDFENSCLGRIKYLEIYPKDIETIVTKEQFKEIEYVL